MKRAGISRAVALAVITTVIGMRPSCPHRTG